MNAYDLIEINLHMSRSKLSRRPIEVRIVVPLVQFQADDRVVIADEL